VAGYIRSHIKFS